MAIVTPKALMQALNAAQRRGSPGDPYGMTSAVKSFTGSLDAMRKAQMDAMTLQEKELRMPAIAAQQQQLMALYAAQQYEQQEKLKVAQDLQQAVQTAIQWGANPNAYDFPLAISKYVKTPGGQAQLGKAVQAVQKEMRDRELQASAIKEGMKQEFVNTRKEDRYQQLRDTRIRPDTPVEERQKLDTLLQKEAEKYAEDAWNKRKIKVDIDPVSGVTSARDEDGGLLPINPRIEAFGRAIRGEKAAHDAFENMRKSDWLYGGEKAQADLDKALAVQQMRMTQDAARQQAITGRSGLKAQPRTELDRRRTAAEAKLAWFDKEIFKNPALLDDPANKARYEAVQDEVTMLDRAVRGVEQQGSDVDPMGQFMPAPAAPVVPVAPVVPAQKTPFAPNKPTFGPGPAIPSVADEYGLSPENVWGVTNSPTLAFSEDAMEVTPRIRNAPVGFEMPSNLYGF